MTRKAILIMTDSQRWDMVNCYRQTGLRTPNLDALAAQGTRFARAYTTQPVCQPARAAIFTGLYPHGKVRLCRCVYHHAPRGAAQKALDSGEVQRV